MGSQLEAKGDARQDGAHADAGGAGGKAGGAEGADGPAEVPAQAVHPEGEADVVVREVHLVLRTVLDAPVPEYGFTKTFTKSVFVFTKPYFA